MLHDNSNDLLASSFTVGLTRDHATEDTLQLFFDVFVTGHVDERIQTDVDVKEHEDDAVVHSYVLVGLL